MEERRTPQRGLPEPMVEALREEWGEGHSASLIATHMRERFPWSKWPIEITRNSIIGCVFRYRKKGLPGFDERAPRSCGSRVIKAPVVNPLTGELVQPKPRARSKYVRHRRTAIGQPAERRRTAPLVQFSKHGAAIGQPKEAQPPAPSLVIETSKPVGLFDLKHGKCRWPVDVEGSESQMYCGGDAVTGKSYCPEHLRRMTR